MKSMFASKEDVILAIQARHRAGLSLVGVEKEDQRLYSAATYRFGKWSRAVVAAGFPARPNRWWSDDRILEELRRWHARGLPMADLRRHDNALCKTAARRFGSWKQAMQLAGIPQYKPRLPSQWREWSKDAVVAAIQSRHQQGASLHAVHREDVGLHSAASREFGTWSNALRAAGLLPFRARWSKKRLLAALREDPELPQRDTVVAEDTRRHFGSLEVALAAAAKVPDPPEQWTKQQVIDALRAARYRSRRRLRKENPQLVRAAVRVFGGWRKATVAAGFRQRARRPGRRWNRELVLEALRSELQRGGTPSTIQNTDSGLYSAATKYCGSFANAMTLAGFPPKLPPPHTRSQVLTHIRARKRPITEEDHLYQEAIQFFGTWAAALQAAKRPKPQRVWNHQRVIEQIRAWDRERQPSIHPSRDLRALYRAARYRYGSWKRALDAADVVPRICLRWTPSRIIAALQACQSLPPKVARAVFHAFRTCATQLRLSEEGLRGGWNRAKNCQEVVERGCRSCHPRPPRAGIAGPDQSPSANLASPRRLRLFRQTGDRRCRLRGWRAALRAGNVQPARRTSNRLRQGTHPCHAGTSSAVLSLAIPSNSD